jgi:predicted metal-binding protein
MKIAILVREETMKTCTGKGCFNAFFNRMDAFQNYGEGVELVGFTHAGGDIAHKIEKLKDNGVEIIHLSTCLRAKGLDYEQLAETLSNDFKVVGYTHGSEIGKTRETVNLEKKQEDKK